MDEFEQSEKEKETNDSQNTLAIKMQYIKKMLL